MDLQQLPGYEAIEEPKETEIKTQETITRPEEVEVDLDDENTVFKIPYQDLRFITGLEKYNKEGWKEIKRKDLEKLWEENGFEDQDVYLIKIVDQNLRTLKVVERKKEEEKEPIKKIISFSDSDLDSGLNNEGAMKILKNLELPLPSDIKNGKHRVIKENKKKLKHI